MALSIALTLNLAFAAADLVLAPLNLIRLLCKLVQIAAMIGGLVVLRRRPSRRVARRVGELAMIVLVATSAVSQVAAGDRDSLPVLAVGLAMGAGAFLPLGVWAQVRIAGAAALAVVAHAFLLGGGFGSLTVVTLIVIGCSVAAAWEATRNRTLVESSLTSLHEAEERFYHLASSAPTIFWWLDRLGNVHYVSPAFERIWGRPVADAYRDWRLVVREGVHPDDRARVEVPIEEISTQGLDEEFRIVRADGSVRRLHVRAYVTEGVPAIAGMTEDVTERRDMEDALRESQKRYAELVENAPDPVLTFDAHGRLLSANPALGRLLGRRSDDLKGRRFLQAGVIARASRAAAIGIVRELTACGTSRPQQLVLIRRGGGQVSVESNQRIVRGAGESIEVEVILRDLTERRRAEETARLRAFAAHLESAREDERGRLARRLHDEFAQWMTALGLHLGWLSQTLPGDLEEPNAKVGEMQSLLTSMVAAVRRMMSDLRPAVLDDFGLAAAVRWEAQAFQTRTGIECVTRIEMDETHNAGGRGVAVFRTVQEALANVAARGARNVRVDLDATAGMIALNVEDDGEAVLTSSLPWDLACMRERTHLLGGSFEVESAAAGGMSIRMRVPSEGAPAADGETPATTTTVPD